MTGKTNVTASQLNQLVDNATVTTNRGLIIATNSAPGTNFANYLWRDISVDPPVLRIYSATYGWTNLVLPTNVVTTASIENNSITGAKLALNTISNVNMKANSIASTNIIDLAVIEAKLAAGSVTETKLGSSSVTADKIANGVITGSKLVNGTITSNQIASGSIISDMLVDGSVIVGKAGQSAIVRTNLAADSVDSTNIVAGTIVGSDIANGTIEAANIKDNTITSSKIVSGGIHYTNAGASFAAYLPLAYGLIAPPSTVTLSQNIDSVAEISAGIYDITLTNMTTTNLIVVGNASSTSPLTVKYIDATLGSKKFRVHTNATGGGATRPDVLQIVVYSY